MLCNWNWFFSCRLARQYTDNEDIVTVEDSFHGNFGVLVDISPKMYQFQYIPNYHPKDWVHIYHRGMFLRQSWLALAGDKCTLALRHRPCSSLIFQFQDSGLNYFIPSPSLTIELSFSKELPMLYFFNKNKPNCVSSKFCCYFW